MISVRMPEEHDEQLRKLAKQEDRSVNWLVGRAIKEFLDRNPVHEDAPKVFVEAGRKSVYVLSFEGENIGHILLNDGQVTLSLDTKILE